MGLLYEITSTPGHKYYLPFNNTNRDINEVLEHESYKDLSLNWVSAKDLKSGDKVLLSNGSYGIIDSVIINELQNEEVTYNLEVEDFHTYFVGGFEVCVHNTNCGDKVIQETINKKGKITSEYELTEKELLETGEKFLGEGYAEIGGNGSGVFRNGNRIFRIDEGSILGKHNPYLPHGHLEILKDNGKRIINNHIIIRR